MIKKLFGLRHIYLWQIVNCAVDDENIREMQNLCRQRQAYMDA